MYIIPYIDFKRVDQKYSGTWKGKLLVEEQYQSQNISLKSNCDLPKYSRFYIFFGFFEEKGWTVHQLLCGVPRMTFKAAVL